MPPGTLSTINLESGDFELGSRTDVSSKELAGSAEFAYAASVMATSPENAAAVRDANAAAAAWSAAAGALKAAAEASDAASLASAKATAAAGIAESSNTAAALDPKQYDQIKTIYDYTKLHFGIYLATPAALMIFINELHVAENNFALVGLLVATGCNFIATLVAGWSMAALVYGGWWPWQPQQHWTNDKFLPGWLKIMRSWPMRLVHHYLYWLGLIVALGCIWAAWRHAHGLSIW
jgi:hypothetical protein